MLKLAVQKLGQPERLKREAELLAACVHPAVVQLLDCDLDGEVPWLVTPRGVPLKEWLSRYASDLAAEERFALSQQIVMTLAEGLALVHTKGVVHRDIKPDNVVLFGGDTTDPKAALIDFGIAFAPDAPSLTELDGRRVRNMFAAPPAAYYDNLDDPPPWWDCLGLAWLWGWLLAETLPDHSRFHWRFHKFIASERTEAVRALCAACCSVGMAPENGKQFIQLCQRLGLAMRTPAINGGTAPTFEHAARVLGEREAAYVLRRAEEEEIAEAGAELLGIIYESVIQQLERVVQQANAELPLLRCGRPQAGLGSTKDVLRLAARSERTVGLFACEWKAREKDLSIVLNVKRRPKASYLPFAFELCTPGGLRSTGGVMHTKDGAGALLAIFEGAPQRRPFDVAEYARTLTVWLQDPTVILGGGD